MMTSDEINAAIERLEKHSKEDHSVHAVLCRLMDSRGWLTSELRGTLISLLRQADPDTHMELPVDADGEYIHIGDEMERGSTHGRVVALMLSNYPKKWNGGRLHWGVQLEGEQAPTALDNYFHHYHKPTIEDVLVDYYKECQLHASELGFVTDEGKERAWRDIATTFAEKIKEAVTCDMRF